MADDIQSLLAQFQPTEADRKAARQQAILAFGLGLLGTPKGAEWQGVGRAGLLGLGNYNQQLLSAPKLRMENAKAAMDLQKTMSDLQFNQLGMNLINGNMGAPQAGPQPGGADVTTAPAPAPSAPQGVPSWANPRAELGFALAGKDKVAEVVHRQYQVTQGPGGTLIRNGQVVGQVIPNAGMMIDGKFQPLPKEATDALVGFSTAQKRGEVQAQAEQDLIPVPMGNGQTRMMTRADAARLFSQQQPQQPQGEAQPGVMQATVPNDAAARAMALAADKQGQPVDIRVPQGMGGLGVTPNPLAMKAAEGAIQTQNEQNNVIAKGQGEDYVKILDAEKQAPNNIAKYDLMKNYLGKVETGKLAKSVLGLKAAAAYVAPELTKGWTKDVPYAQAAAALSNEIALQLRNPTGGAGMPGSLSDRDREFLVSMTANAENDPRAIPAMLDARIALEKRSQDIGKIARSYRQQHGTLDEGFYQAIQDYANANPLFKGIATPSSGRGVIDFSDLVKGRR